MPQDPCTRRGTLFLIVGPSGAGKDSLIAEARTQLAATHVFARRVITRRPDSGSEDHISESDEQFLDAQRDGRFALSWSAHKLLYGIPSSFTDELARGRHVVANVSRLVVEEARRAFSPVVVVLVTASSEVLESRLKARGREVPSDIEERLARHVELRADATIINEGSLETAVIKFLTILRG